MSPELEMARRGVETEPNAGDRHLEIDTRPFDCRLKVRYQPVERDRAIHQAPEHKPDEHGQDRGEGCEPPDDMMHAAPDAPSRPLVHDPACAPAVLTEFGRRATVAALAGIVRWECY